ncbi:MAG: hypothetical protein QNJ45_23535 [Ardenticatenaceae bacterium]|nr:hypothetical protein [Ardenticatenaceae bacterium]
MADQDPDLFEEFIVEEEEETQSNRPFVFAAAGLVGILVLCLGVLGVYQLFFDGADDGQAVAEGDAGIAATATVISATNEAIETQNAYVTQTLVAMELTANAPTETPTPLPTATATPVPTATPTVTPVVQAEDDEGDEVAEDVTRIFDEDDDEEDDDEVAADEDDDTADTVGSADVSANTGNATETLPETGISIWGGIAAALGLIFLMFIARRFRMN